MGIPVSEIKLIADRIQRGERECSRAKQEMIEPNLRLVISIAKNTLIEDFSFRSYSRGNIGLMKAVGKLNIKRL